MPQSKRFLWRTADGITHITIWIKQGPKPRRDHFCYCSEDSMEGRRVFRGVMTCIRCLVESQTHEGL